MLGGSAVVYAAVIIFLLSLSGPLEAPGVGPSRKQSPLNNAKVYPCNTWKRASTWCQSAHKDAQLPVVRNKLEYETVVMEMVAQRINATWLGLRRRKLKTFAWLDCQPAPKYFVERKRPWLHSSNCAYLDTDEAVMMAGLCFKSHGRGAVCESRGCVHCGDQCDRIRGRCYIPTCTPLSWEAARAYCRSRGLDLAIFGNGREEEKIRKALSSRLAEKPCNLFWVGLRRQEWTNPNSAYHDITDVYWDENEPAEDKGDCSVMINTDKGFKWKEVACNSSYQSICLRSHIGLLDNPTTSVSVYTTISKSAVETEQPSHVPKIVEHKESHVVIAVWVLCAGVFILSVVILIKICLDRRRLKEEPCKTQQTSGTGPRINRNLPANLQPQSRKNSANKGVKYKEVSKKETSGVPSAETEEENADEIVTLQSTS